MRSIGRPGALVFAALLLPISLAAQSAGRRLLTLDDLARLREVEDPQVSPEGTWVAYTVTRPDLKADGNDSDIWMTSWDGDTTLRLTYSTNSEHAPRWSPDGRWLGFLSDRGDPNEVDQLWALNRSGGEAEQLTCIRSGISDYAWAPDGKRLVLTIEDPDAGDTAAGDSAKAGKTPPPIVIDRYQFKQDYVGYLGKKRTHLYLFDLATRHLDTLTAGSYDELLPAWSPDGQSVAFVSKRVDEMDRSSNWDLYVIAARPGAMPRRLTTFEGADNDPSWESHPAWSPDGSRIAYFQGEAPRLIYYADANQKLAVVSVAGGPPRLLTADLDRTAIQPRWSPDGMSIVFLLEDDRAVHLARVAAGGGRIERLLSGREVVSGFSMGADGRIAALRSDPSTPAEVVAVASGGNEPRRLSQQNDSLLASIQLGTTEEIGFRSRDGTVVHGFLVKPPDFRGGTRYPAVLRTHGGPVSQHQNEFDFGWQLLAANGYVVIAANPRGSSGRGLKYATAIYADWGNKDVEDVLAAVDYAVAKGVADPQRLGIGGWSYGGILTNYTIARDPRFKAAISGASISNILAGYGTDQYIREYELELGRPWQNTATWLKLSYPFLHADRIITPTLFIGAEKDFNVPLLNSEQMYQALKSLGRETELVIYPGQHHGIRKPSYLRDRYQRYLAWYDRHVKGDSVRVSTTRR